MLPQEQLIFGIASGLLVWMLPQWTPLWRDLIAGTAAKSGPGMSPRDLIPIVILIVAAGLAVYALLRGLLASGNHFLPTSSAKADYESTDTTTPAVPASDNNWRWARRIEADERIAEAALRKEEAAAISALEQDG